MPLFIEELYNGSMAPVGHPHIRPLVMGMAQVIATVVVASNVLSVEHAALVSLWDAETEEFPPTVEATARREIILAAAAAKARAHYFVYEALLAIFQRKRVAAWTLFGAPVRLAVAFGDPEPIDDPDFLEQIAIRASRDAPCMPPAAPAPVHENDLVPADYRRLIRLTLQKATRTGTDQRIMDDRLPVDMRRRLTYFRAQQIRKTAAQAVLSAMTEWPDELDQVLPDPVANGANNESDDDDDDQPEDDDDASEKDETGDTLMADPTVVLTP